MEFSTNTTTTLHTLKTAALAVGIFAEGQLTAAAKIIDDASNGAVRDAVKAEFPGTAGTQLVLRNLAGVSAQRVILIGLGKQEAYNAKTHAAAEQSFAKYCVQAQLAEGVSTLARTDCKDSTLQQRAQALAVAVGQATYQYDATLGKTSKKTAPKLKKISTWVTRAEADEANAGLQSGRAMANGMQLARTLGDLPGNICTPTYLGNTAKKLAKTHKTLKVEVLGLKQLQELGMGSFLSVAKGSDEPPVFIVIKYTPAAAAKAARAKAKAPVVLVGKGITFDSGGISIKPGANMDEMKYDMCGAASVLGTMHAVVNLNLPINIVAVLAAAENMPDANAYRPGDILTTMSGQTVEVLNTDAEGRLVLCDALTYVERFDPELVIDVATLTGACVIALGKHATGLLSNHNPLAHEILNASDQSGDRAWRLPLWDDYQDQLESPFADFSNLGGRAAGTITAACFLSRFTRKYNWAHLDIAGTAWRSGGKDKGATGRPVPMLTQFLLNRVSQQQDH